jgi:ubiquinone/menaquinone biosynthesis C-methylase UbiE
MRGRLRSRVVLRDYSRQAQTYDITRSASPSVLGPLREALAGAPGRRLLDVGGGTGNYARALAAEGWEPVVLDRSPAMLARAAAKGLPTVEGDAQDLPFADASFDAAMLVAMLHHVEDPERAVGETRRVVRPGGRIALMGWSQEDLDGQWYTDYFPSTRGWIEDSHRPIAEKLGWLPGARRIPVVFDDLEDASLAALAAHPEKLLEERWRRQTSFFELLEREHPEELQAGLERLARDVADGRVPRGRGVASVIAWTAPG